MVKGNNTEGLFRWWVWALVACVGFLPQSVGASGKPATAHEKSNQVAESALSKLLKEAFSYELDRADPFMPFVSAQTAKEQDEDDLKALTGMQLFEPGQLDLVAILFSGKRAMAMVQDSTGKGYIIEEGTKIGRRGQVSKIKSNIVVIKDWFMSSSGKRNYRNSEMVLRKEGGNQ